MWTFVVVDNSTLLTHVVFVLGGHVDICMVLCSLKWTCMLALLHVFLNFSLSPLMYGTTIYMFLLLESMLVVVLDVSLLALCGPIMLSAHGRNLNTDNAFLIWLFSSCSEDWLVQMTLALCATVLNMLFLADMEWLLSQWRYLLVCLGFLYTVVVRVLSGLVKPKCPRRVGNHPDWDLQW